MKPSEMTIVPMGKNHVAAVAALEGETFSAPWSQSSIEGELSNPLSLWLVALDGAQVVGYVGSQTVLGEADMMNLAVATSHRRQGIGMALVRITRAIFSDEDSILTISSLVDGPYGIRETYLGLPCIVGRQGRVKLLELDLNDEETAKLRKSASIIREAYDSIRF